MRRVRCIRKLLVAKGGSRRIGKPFLSAKISSFEVSRDDAKQKVKLIGVSHRFEQIRGQIFGQGGSRTPEEKGRKRRKG